MLFTFFISLISVLAAIGAFALWLKFLEWLADEGIINERIYIALLIAIPAAVLITAAIMMDGGK